MKQPWIKFYPSDWRADPKLRLCSMGARGVWMELICLMHEGEPYGHLAINGTQPTKAQVARLCGCSEREATKWIGELIENDVLAASQDFWYSRRLVRDKEKAEADKLNGKGGGNPKLRVVDNGGVNPPDNGGDKAQKLETRDQKIDKKDLSNLIGSSIRKMDGPSRADTNDPRVRKQRWEQRIGNEVLGTFGPTEGARIIEAYANGDPAAKQIFNALSDGKKIDAARSTR